jgi:hypothetical protein
VDVEVTPFPLITARKLIAKHGRRARIVALQRALRLARATDADGKTYWLRVAAAIELERGRRG